MPKSAKIWLSKSIFWVKNHPNLFQSFFLLKNTNLGAQFLSLTFFDQIIFQNFSLLKWCPIFDSSPFIQNSKFNNFLWVYRVCWSLCKNLSNFVSPVENSKTRIAIVKHHWFFHQATNHPVFIFPQEFYRVNSYEEIWKFEMLFFGVW